ncbi:hypothetical protein BCR42DRAFT_416342 [Absidia repens]|uniref:Uncharacterized protein n=1 Tax=Absidia repens TaxID=90262 RepID=A0A1X2IEC2_9FUNG|nr:hypothetical protein BCR42DRAFT_416342 [Absidia repens]
MPMFTKLHSIRSSMSFSFTSNHRPSSSSPPLDIHQATTLPYSRSYVSVTNLSKQQQQQQLQPHHHRQQQQNLVASPSYQGLQRQRTNSTPTVGFTETLRMISKQVQQDRFDDVFGSFFFTDKRCHDRAIFMAARLLQNLGYTFVQQHPANHAFWKTVIHRFYTLNYLLFVVPSTDQTRTNYLAALEQQVMRDQPQHTDRRGGMEIYFAFYYAAIQHGLIKTINNKNIDTISLLEQSRTILEHCLDSENKLGHAERDAMYIFHGLRAGFQCDEDAVAVMMDDDDRLLAILQEAVRNNKNLTKQPYVNPFEDDACIVDSDDDDTIETWKDNQVYRGPV